jgi:hypothetical protein
MIRERYDDPVLPPGERSEAGATAPASLRAPGGETG